MVQRLTGKTESQLELSPFYFFLSLAGIYLIYDEKDLKHFMILLLLENKLISVEILNLNQLKS